MKNKALYSAIAIFGLVMTLVFVNAFSNSDYVKYNFTDNSQSNIDVLGTNTSNSLSISNTVQSITDNGDGSFNIVFVYGVANNTDKKIASTIIQTDLNKTFGAGNYQFVSLTSIGLEVNPKFNGSSNKILMAPSATMESGQSGQLILTVRYFGESGSFNNVVSAGGNSNVGVGFEIVVPNPTVIPVPTTITPEDTTTTTPTPTEIPTNTDETIDEGEVVNNEETNQIVDQNQIDIDDTTIGPQDSVSIQDVLGDDNTAATSESGEVLSNSTNSTDTKTFEEILGGAVDTKDDVSVLGVSDVEESYDSGWVILCCICLLLFPIFLMLLLLLLNKKKKEREEEKTVETSNQVL